MKTSSGNEKKKKGGRSALFLILTALGILAILYGLLVIAIIGGGHWFNFAGIITGAGLIIWALLLPLIAKLPKNLKRLLCLLIIAALIVFGAAESQIINTAASAPQPGADWVIVLGAKVNGTAPSLTLSRRINKAASYIGDNPESLVIASGGQGSDENISEAECIKTRLVSLGASEAQIFEEAESTTTKENLVNSLKIIEENGGSPEDRVLIISSDFHLFRAKLLAKKAGYKNIETLGAMSMAALVPQYYAREFAALISEKLDGNI